MNCLDCQELVQLSLDGQRIDASRSELELHLSQCRACRKLWAATQRLSEGLRFLTLSPVPPRLSQQLFLTLVVDHGRRHRLRRVWIPLASAAALLLATWVGYFTLRPTPRPVQSEAHHESYVPPVKNPALPAVAVSLHQSVEEAGKAVFDLTRRTADETMGQSRLLLPQSGPDTPAVKPNESQSAEPTTQSLESVPLSMSAGLEPVTTSARRAVALFWREIPDSQPAASKTRRQGDKETRSQR